MTKEEQLLEEAGVKVPPFDEKDFIRKELISFKTTAVLFVFSILIAGLSYLVWKAAQWPFLWLLIAALVVGSLLLRPVYKLARIDVSHWKRKEWIGTVLLYGFFWLGFFLLFTNPPVADASSPKIQVELSPIVQSPNQTVDLAAYAADNVGIRGEPAFCLLRIAGAIPSDEAGLTEAQRATCVTSWKRVEGAPVWTTVFTPTQPGTYAAFVRATDKNGHASIASINFTVGSPFLIVDPPGPNEASVFVDTGTYFSIQPRTELQPRLVTVQYRIDGGDWHHFVRDKNREGFWITDPTYPGWKSGPNTAEVRAVEHPRFLLGGHQVGGGIVQDARSFKVTVDADYPAALGTATEPNPTASTYVPPGQTPSLGFPGIAVGLLLLALVLRRRSRDA